jgi:hypothetical protein
MISVILEDWEHPEWQVKIDYFEEPESDYDEWGLLDSEKERRHRRVGVLKP